jgi:hypothetical protein
MLKTAFGNHLKLIDATHQNSIETIFGEYVALIRNRDLFADQLLALSSENCILLANTFLWL